jgi:preprotein translocase subunit SecE
VAVPVQAQPQQNFVQRSIGFYHDVMAEMKKVTWPDLPQVRQLSFSVILLSLFIGGLIAVMDVILQQVLVRWIPSLFGG